MKNCVGMVLSGRFQVEQLITEDSSGGFYRGLDVKRSLPVSIRVYEKPVPYDPAALCFQQNEMTLQTVMHPNLMQFYGLYEDQGLSFMVEKFVEGVTLAQVFQQRNGQPFPVQEALTYLKSLANALEYLHGFGQVHCSLSPFSVLVGRDGIIRLTNFGFSRQADRPMGSTSIMGLPAYLAPEQLRGGNVYPASDIYALGVLFFELLAGRHPFLNLPTSAARMDTATIERLRAAHLSQPAPDLRQFNPNMAAGFTQIVQIAMAKDPKQRYQSAQEMLEIACAVVNTSPREVSDRIHGGAPVAPTQVVAATGSQFVQPMAGSAPAYYQSPGGTQVVSQPGMPVAVAGGTQVVQPGWQDPRANAAGPSGTQLVQAPGWQGEQGGPPPAAPYYPLEEQKPRRPTWVWILIGLLVAGIVLCAGLALGAGLPILKEMLASATPTITETATSLPTNTALPPPTQPPAVMATNTTAPTATLPPTLPPPPPPPTSAPIPSPTTQPSSFTVTIRNNQSYPIFAFRDGQLMGTDPIPPAHYIYYHGIPPGPHQFTFCADIQFRNCPVTKQVVVDKDMTIAVP